VSRPAATAASGRVQKPCNPVSKTRPRCQCIAQFRAAGRGVEISVALES